MRTFHHFAALFGAYTRKPRRICTNAGNWYIIIDTEQGAFEFPTLLDMRYCVAIGSIPDDYKLPF